MSNLYIDHSVVSREQSWPDLKQVIEEGNLKLTLSLWNLVEIGNAGDLAQRARRLEFLAQFNPLWILERVDVQRQEVKRFLWTEHFRTKPEDLSVFVPHLSMVDASHIGWRMRVGLTPGEWIEGIDFAQIEANKTLAPNALKILQDVGAAQVKKRQHEIFKRWIKPLIPDVDPSGQPLTRIQMEECSNSVTSAAPLFSSRANHLPSKTRSQQHDPLTPAGSPRSQTGSTLCTPSSHLRTVTILSCQIVTFILARSKLLKPWGR